MRQTANPRAPLRRGGATLRLLAALILGASIIETFPPRAAAQTPTGTSMPQQLAHLAQFPPSGDWFAIAKDALSPLGLTLHPGATWKIGAPNTAKQPSLTLFDSRTMPSASASTFRDNCLYISEADAITCDVNMFRDLATLYGLHETEKTTADARGHIIHRSIVPRDPQDIRNDYIRFFGWVLGHEVGHAYHGHAGTFRYLAHPAPPPAGSASPELHMARRAITYNRCHSKEAEADAFFHAQLRTNNMHVEYYRFLLELLNRDIKRSACPGAPLSGICERLFPGTGVFITSEKVIATASRTHPAFLMRILDLMDGIRHHYPWSGGEFHRQIEGFREGGVILRKSLYDGVGC
jgi:hypothetical protein